MYIWRTMNKDMAMAKRIYDLLQAKNGGNQSELARHVGVTPQVVQQWVAGETTPRGKNLQKLAKFLGVTPARLQYGIEPGAGSIERVAREVVADLLRSDGWEVESLDRKAAASLPPEFSGDDYQYVPDLRIRKGNRELFVEITSWKYARLPSMKKLAADSGRLVLVDWDSPEEAVEKANNLLRGPGAAVEYRDTIVIPVLDVAGSMGLGLTLPEHDEVVERMTVSWAWLRRNVSATSPSNLALITAYGDSMEGTFSDGDLLLVDRGICEIKIDAVYVLALNDELYIKRLQRRPDGSVLMISDNKKYEPYLIQNGERQKFQVLGRVLLAWNAQKM